MAVANYLELLFEDVFAWNKWRRSLPKDVELDFSDVDFVTKRNIVDLSGANLYGVSLRRALLDLAYFGGANFYQADLREASFNSTSLSGANLREANLTDADFAQACMQGATLDKATLYQTGLQWANLSGASLI